MEEIKVGEQRAFKGIWIPAEVWLNDELSLIEKVMFAEIDSLDGEDGCYATNDYFVEFFKVSESTITRAIATLKRLGYIESTMIGGRTRILRVVKMTTQSSQIDDAGSSKNSVSSIIEKKINNIKDKSTGAGALAKHPRNFSNNTLTDDLQSGKDIDEQKKIKKKTSEYDKCLAEIDKRYDDPNIYSAVLNHLDWSYNSKDPNRIKTLKTFVKRLDELDRLILGRTTDVAVKIIQQSIDKKWHCFYEIKENKTKSYSDHSDGIIAQKLSQEEAAELLAREAEEYGVI